MKGKLYKQPAFAWALLILVLTLSPGSFIPKVDYWSIVSLDKYVHTGIFFVLVFLLFIQVYRHANISSQQFVLYTLGGVVYGVLIEFIQQFIPMRSFELNDMFANTLGCVLAMLLFVVLQSFRKVKA